MRLRIVVVAACALALVAACGPGKVSSPPAHKQHPPHAAQATGPVQTPPAATAPDNTSPVMTPSVPQSSTAVNGCNPTMADPAAPFGGCLDGPLPQFFCCSAALLGWSGVYVGMELDMKGAVPLDASGKPQSSAVLIVDPNGKETAIPVSASGAFGQNYTFAQPGTYAIGVLYKGTPADLVRFQVGWRYEVLQGATLAGIFPGQGEGWPPDDVFLAALSGQPNTWTLRVENAQGQPQPGARITTRGPVANAQGVVTLTLPAPQGLDSPGVIAPGLYDQVYEDVVPSGNTLAGYPPPDTQAEVAPGPVSIAVGQVRYYDVQDFFAFADVLFQFRGGGQPAEFAYDPTAGAFSLFDGASGNYARLLVATGTLQKGQYSSPTTATWTDVGTVHPVVQQGQVYVPLQDMVSIAQVIGWAVPDGRGGVLFSDAFVP